jgi:hypothetical protein
MLNTPCSRLYSFDLMSIKSDDDLTGRKRDRGTLIPMAVSKCLIAAPMAGVSCDLGSVIPPTSLELDNSLSSVGDLHVSSRLRQVSKSAHLVVDNDLHVKDILVHHSLNRLQVAPNVVGVEDLPISWGVHWFCTTNLELPGRAELVQVVLRHLSDLEQSDFSIVVDDRTSLDIRLGLVGDLHDILSLAVDHGLHNVQVDDGTQVVDVGDEDVLFTGGNELVKKTRVAIISQTSTGTLNHALTSRRQRCLRVLGGTSWTFRSRQWWDMGGATPCRHVDIAIAQR